jgi:hypothetical protein
VSSTCFEHPSVHPQEELYVQFYGNSFMHPYKESGRRHCHLPGCLYGWSCSKALYKPVWYIPLLSVQWINSWWLAEELSETCRVSCQNKFVKLVHLVSFIMKSIFIIYKCGRAGRYLETHDLDCLAATPGVLMIRVIRRWNDYWQGKKNNVVGLTLSLSVLWMDISVHTCTYVKCAYHVLFITELFRPLSLSSSG